jgi:hypothetical protein
MNIGYKKVKSIEINYYIRIEFKKSYITQVFLVYYPPLFQKSISISKIFNFIRYNFSIREVLGIS